MNDRERKRMCLNCRHRRISNGIGDTCDIDNHYMHYAEVFEHWCAHWTKEDGEENDETD